MAKNHIDFVGLNTFIYEPVGYLTTEQLVAGQPNQPGGARLTIGARWFDQNYF